MLPETGGLNRFNDELQREYDLATHKRFPLGRSSNLHARQVSISPSRAFLAQASESSQYVGPRGTARGRGTDNRQLTTDY